MYHPGRGYWINVSKDSLTSEERSKVREYMDFPLLLFLLTRECRLAAYWCKQWDLSTARCVYRARGIYVPF